MTRPLEARSASVYRLRRADREIVEGILSQDPSSARALVDKYGRLINHRVWRLLGADPEHEDVVQQVFVTILKSLPKLKDPEALPDHSVVMIGIRVKDMDLVKKGDEFSKLRGVISVAVVTGRFDLILTVMLTKDFGMLEFYTEEASKIDKIQSVETFVIYKSFNMKVTLPPK